VRKQQAERLLDEAPRDGYSGIRVPMGLAVYLRACTSRHGAVDVQWRNGWMTLRVVWLGRGTVPEAVALAKMVVHALSVSIDRMRRRGVEVSEVRAWDPDEWETL